MFVFNMVTSKNYGFTKRPLGWRVYETFLLHKCVTILKGEILNPKYELDIRNQG